MVAHHKAYERDLPGLWSHTAVLMVVDHRAYGLLLPGLWSHTTWFMVSYHEVSYHRAYMVSYHQAYGLILPGLWSYLTLGLYGLIPPGLWLHTTRLMFVNHRTYGHVPPVDHGLQPLDDGTSRTLWIKSQFE